MSARPANTPLSLRPAPFGVPQLGQITVAVLDKPRRTTFGVLGGAAAFTLGGSQQAYRAIRGP